MKRLIASLTGLTLATFIASPSYGCDAKHGYTKTAQLVEQSSLSEHRKIALMEVISESKAYHDQYTAEGKFGQMQNSVQKLLQVRQELGL